MKSSLTYGLVAILLLILVALDYGGLCSLRAKVPDLDGSVSPIGRRPS